LKGIWDHLVELTLVVALTMVKFGDYLTSCIIERYSSKYIKYEELKNILDKAKKKKLKLVSGISGSKSSSKARSC